MNCFTVVTNTSAWPTDEIMPLLRFAYNSVKPEFKKPEQTWRWVKPRKPMQVHLSRCKTATWHYRWRYSVGVTMSFAAPGCGNLPTEVGGVACNNLHEVIVALAAWLFMALAGQQDISKSAASCAVREYRLKHAEISAKIEAIRQGKVDKKGEVFAKAVFDDMERNTFKFKLAQITRLEQGWLRKAKLAATRLQTLRRRKAALAAARTRKQRQETLVIV